MIRRYSLIRSDNYPFTGRMSYACSGSGTIFVYTGFKPKSAMVSLSTIPSSGTGYIVESFVGEGVGALDDVVGDDIDMYSIDSKWRLDNIRLLFSSADPKDYAVYVKNGRRIIEGLNDIFNIYMETEPPFRSIKLDPGFYTGTEIASELKAKLELEYSVGGYIFNVSYSSVTGLFTISESGAENLQYIDSGSSAGYVFGFTTDSILDPTLISDTADTRLDQELSVIEGTASTTLEHYNDDVKFLSIDQSLRLYMGAAPVTIDYSIEYAREGAVESSQPRIYVSGYESDGFTVAYSGIPEAMGFIEFSYIAS